MSKLLELYTNPSEPGSLIASGIKANYPKLFKKYNNLNNFTPCNLHKLIRRKFKRRQVISKGIDYIWQVDLIDKQKLMYQNSHFNFNFILKYILQLI